MGALNWVVAGAILILLVGMVDIAAGCYLCCHPDADYIVERRDLFGLGENFTPDPEKPSTDDEPKGDEPKDE